MNNINRRKFLALTAMGTTSLAVFGKNMGFAFIRNPVFSDIYRFRIGRFSCININTAIDNYEIEAFFDGVPAVEIQKELGLSEPPETVDSSFACMFVDTGKNRILIDAGDKNDADVAAPVVKYLLQENIPAESIDSVIITHAHPDHITGLLDERGNLCFPKATYYSTKEEWDFYKDEEAFKKAKVDYPHFKLFGVGLTVYEKIKDKLVFVEPGKEIFPGIKVIDTKGHTSGQLAVIVSSSGEKLIYISDVVFHPLNLKHPDWVPWKKYVFNMDEYRKTKKRILDMAAEENMLVAAMHFYPPPSLGHVKKNGNGWEWIPISQA